MPPSRSHARRALTAATLAGVLAAPAAARADGLVFRLPVFGPASYSFTSTSQAAFRTTNFDRNPYDDNFFGLIERFDSALAAPPWRAQLRIDGFMPFLVPEGPANCPVHECYLRPDLRPERLALRYHRGILLLEGGDVYTVLGRGVALAFRKYDPLGIDTTIRGGRAEVDAGRFLVRGFGGVANPQNLDPVTLAIWQDTQTPGTNELRPGYDALGGGEMVARLGPDEDIEFGVHALRVHFPQSPLRDSNVDVIGYRFQVPALFDGAATLHIEVNALRRTTMSYRLDGTSGERGALRDQQERYGRAVYAATQLLLGNWNALVEWKDYNNFVLSHDGSANDPRRVYSAAPSLEREDVQIRSNYNARGGRVRLEHAFRPSPWMVQLTGMAQGFSEEIDRDPWASNSLGAVHGYVQLRRRGRPASRTPGLAAAGAPGGAGAQGGAGGAAGAPPEAGAGTAPVGSAATGGIGGSGGRVALGDWQFSATLGYRHEFLLGPQAMRQGGELDRLVVHGDVDVTWALGVNDSIEARLDGRYETWFDDLRGYYSFTRSGLTLTWSHTDRLQVSAVGRIDNRLVAEGRTTDAPFFYPAGELRYRFMAGSTVRLFGGLMPGGRLCSGGLCRDVPPFQGMLAELILRI